MKHLAAVFLLITLAAPAGHAAPDSVLAWAGFGSYTPAGSTVPEMKDGVNVSFGMSFPVSDWFSVITELAGYTTEPADDTLSGTYFFSGSELYAVLGPTRTVVQPYVGLGVASYETHYEVRGNGGSATSVKTTGGLAARAGVRIVLGMVFVEAYGKVLSNSVTIEAYETTGDTRSGTWDMGGTATGIAIGGVFPFSSF